MLGNFYSTGQICTNGTRVFVHRSVKDAFLDRLVARTRKIRLGDPLNEDTQLGPLVSAAQRDKVLGYIESGKVGRREARRRRRRAEDAGHGGRLLDRADDLRRRRATT